MTTLVVVTEQHFLRAPDGSFHVVGSEDDAFFARYLDAFETVKVLSRAHDVGSLPENARPVESARVTFLPLADFHGVAGSLRGALPAMRAIHRVVRDHPDALFMLRPPGVVSLLVYAALAAARAGYAVELVADPAESLRAEAFGSKALALLRAPLDFAFERMCADALAVSYVTERHLQESYPARSRSVEYACPDGDLPRALFDRAPEVRARIESSPDRLERVRLFLTGRMDRPFKGVDVALAALASMREGGRDVTLEVAGGGRLLTQYRDLAETLGVADAVEWLDEIRDQAELAERMVRADLFILPTRREGLPRALLEAMALGLPCIATPVAGIPELLPAEDMVAVDDPRALAEKIELMAGDRAARLRASLRNHERARGFEASELLARREAFLRSVAAAHRASLR